MWVGGTDRVEVGPGRPRRPDVHALEIGAAPAVAAADASDGPAVAAASVLPPIRFRGANGARPGGRTATPSAAAGPAYGGRTT